MEIPYEVTARRDTGLYNAKVGIWLFLASEVMLFGGLFSAYVFLRVGVNDGVDTPWPMGLDVHGSGIWLGFLNTIILILSSVFVVFAWLALKERNWNVFRNWMSAVIACAAIFMCVKAFEYNKKLNHHYGIKLNDDSVVEGEIANGTDKISFEASKVTLSLQSDLPAFVGHVDGAFPDFTVMEGEETIALKGEKGLKKWFYKKRARVSQDLAASRKEFRAAKKKGEPAQLKIVSTKAELTAVKLETLKLAPDMNVEALEGRLLFNNITEIEEADKESEGEEGDTKEAEEEKVVIVVAKAYEPMTIDVVSAILASGMNEIEVITFKPFKLLAKDRKITTYDKAKLNYIDNVVVEGKLINDHVELIPHQIDLQMVPIGKQQDSMAWGFFEKYPKVRPNWEKAQEKSLEKIRGHFKGEPIPGKVVQSAYINLHTIPHEDFEGEGDDHAKSEEKKSEDDPHKGDHAEEKHGHADADGHGDHGDEHHTISVPRSDIRFMGNHGPRYGNYYAIYFTMTALHGLHVIGGALVLLHFVMFGKKLYLKNPEHLANRVEVGGLFWHFVDLVWIFLFPIMYLL